MTKRRTASPEERLEAFASRWLEAAQQILPNLALQKTRGRKLCFALYPSSTKTPEETLQVILEISESSLRLSLRAPKEDSPALQAQKTSFFDTLRADKNAQHHLALLVKQGFIIRGDNNKLILSDAFLATGRGRLERTWKQSLAGAPDSLGEDLLASLQQLLRLYRYTQPNPSEDPRTLLPLLKTFVASRGFVFDDDTLLTCLVALTCRPLLIFSGVSGTGKTKLSQLLAEFFCGPLSQNPRIAFVPVRPDWLDPRGLLGYHDILRDRYQGTTFLELLLRAQHDPAPHFAILDEFNLSRPEHFLADILSALESRRYDADGKLIYQASVTLHATSTPLSIVDGMGVTRDVSRELTLPPNVFLLGTMNIDESSFEISPRLYDRACVLCLSPAPLKAQLAALYEGQTQLEDAQPLTESRYLCKLRPPQAPRSDALITQLDRLHTLLAEEGSPIGLRSAREALRLAEEAYALDERHSRWALDTHLLLRVLPRLLARDPFSRRALEKLLRFVSGQERCSLETLLEDDTASWPYPRSGALLQQHLVTTQQNA